MSRITDEDLQITAGEALWRLTHWNEAGKQGGIQVFNTIQDVKNKTWTIDDIDTLVLTRGYYNIDDTGSALYKVSSDKQPWSIAIGSYFLNIQETKTVTYRQFGAILDGKDDDTPSMTMCHQYADSIRHVDSENHQVYYTCKVENHVGIIYKKSADPIMCNSSVDLSGSTLLIDDNNASWFGIYKWGNNESLSWDYEIEDDSKLSFTKDSYVIDMPSNDELPSNTVLHITEAPYSVRDDAGYLYSVGRSELLIHDMDGICSSPFADDWIDAGGEEINCKVSNLVTGVDENIKSFSKLSARYTYIPHQLGEFVGCEVLLNMSANKYCSVLSAERHNAVIRDFVLKPKRSELHNMAFKNAMIYLRNSYNVTVRNLQGFNASGKILGAEKATSGYMLRMTNCSDVHVEDCRLQGYWGSIAMDSVKNLHFERCNLNRLDVHDYFYNVYANDCVFYHHAAQLGYGRGMASFTNCTFYYNLVPFDSYKEAYAVALNLTYGRIFEGTLILENCNVHVADAPNDEYSLIEMFFSPEATAITKHFKFPEIRCRNINIISKSDTTSFCYVRAGGTRLARTGIEIPTHKYGHCTDGDLEWQFVGRGVDWGDTTGLPNQFAAVGTLLRIKSSVLNSEGKTNFYDYRYYMCSTPGTVDWSGEVPNKNATTIIVGSAIFNKIEDMSWKSRHAYSVGDMCSVSPSNFYAPYVYTCTNAGTSNGYFPVHTSGTVIDGVDDSVQEQDACWWKYVGTTDGLITVINNDSSGTEYSIGQMLLAEDRIYEVIQPVTRTDYPPFETPWLANTEYGGGVLKYLGSTWKPKKWFALGSYCIADNRLYQLEKHAGSTSGTLPTRGNKYSVDGDITWEYKTGEGTPSEPVATIQSEMVEWTASTSYAVGTLINANGNIYEVQPRLTSSSVPEKQLEGRAFLDGTLPVRSLGTHSNTWRVAGNSYTTGDYIFDNTFIVRCKTSGTTDASNKWGCTEDALGWKSDGTYVDGSCVWQKVTATSTGAVWRNGNRTYQDWLCLLIDNSDGTVTLSVVLPALSGETMPVYTGSDAFLDGNITLKYKGEIGMWMPNSRYSLGSTITVGGTRVYECAFDGRMELPHFCTFDRITTNLNNGSVFKFSSNTDVPTKLNTQHNRCSIYVQDCEGLTSLVTGLTSSQPFFGTADNPDPSFYTNSIPR